MAAAKKVKIRFLQTRKVQDEEGRIFEEGKSYELPEDSANHWLSRNVAELADSKPTVKTTVKTADKADEE